MEFYISFLRYYLKASFGLPDEKRCFRKITSQKWRQQPDQILRDEDLRRCPNLLQSPTGSDPKGFQNRVFQLKQQQTIVSVQQQDPGRFPDGHVDFLRKPHFSVLFSTLNRNFLLVHSNENPTCSKYHKMRFQPLEIGNIDNESSETLRFTKFLERGWVLCLATSSRDCWENRSEFTPTWSSP